MRHNHRIRHQPLTWSELGTGQYSLYPSQSNRTRMSHHSDFVDPESSIRDRHFINPEDARQNYVGKKCIENKQSR